MGNLRQRVLDRNTKPDASSVAYGLRLLYRFAIDLLFIISESKSVNVGLDRNEQLRGKLIK